MAILEETMKEAGLVEMMKKMYIVTEDLTIICGNWDETSIKLGVGGCLSSIVEENLGVRNKSAQ